MLQEWVKLNLWITNFQFHMWMWRKWKMHHGTKRIDNVMFTTVMCWKSFTHTHGEDGLVLLVRLFLLLLLLLSASPPHDGLRLVLFTAQVVSVGQAGTPHHFTVAQFRAKNCVTIDLISKALNLWEKKEAFIHFVEWIVYYDQKRKSFLSS